MRFTLAAVFAIVAGLAAASPSPAPQILPAPLCSESGAECLSILGIIDTCCSGLTCSSAASASGGLGGLSGLAGVRAENFVTELMPWRANDRVCRRALRPDLGA